MKFLVHAASMFTRVLLLRCLTLSNMSNCQNLVKLLPRERLGQFFLLLRLPQLMLWGKVQKCEFFCAIWWFV